VIAMKNLALALLLALFAATALVACDTGGDARGMTASPYDAPWFNRSPG
jgi:hypothetical protein